MKGQNQSRRGVVPSKPLSRMTNAEYSAWYTTSGGWLPFGAGYSDSRLVHRQASDVGRRGKR